MYPNRRPTPFNPDDYTIPGTFVALTTGMEATLARWAEIPIEMALVLPAFYMEGRDRGEEHGVPMFAPTSPWTVERERTAVSKACLAVVQRARADGHDDVMSMVHELRASLRPVFEAAIVKFKEQQRPKWLLDRLFGK